MFSPWLHIFIQPSRSGWARIPQCVVLHPGTRLPSAGGSLLTGFLRLAPTISLAQAPDTGLWKHCLSCPHNPLEKRGQKHCQCSALLGKACWAGAPRGEGGGGQGQSWVIQAALSHLHYWCKEMLGNPSDG